MAETTDPMDDCLGQEEKESSTRSAKGLEAGVEGVQRSGTGGDMNVEEAFFLVLGSFLTIGDGEGGGDRVAFLVEEVEGAVINSGVARLEESTADGVADLVAFRVNSLNVKGETGCKGVKDGPRRDSFNVGTNGSESRV